MVIRLFCAAGMSTSVLVNKMREAAVEKGKDAEIEAFPIAEMEMRTDGIDVALLGPQVGFQLDKAKKICEPKGIPVAVIPMADYGMYKGMNVLKFAYKLKSSKEFFVIPHNFILIRYAVFFQTLILFFILQ